MFEDHTQYTFIGPLNVCKSVTLGDAMGVQDIGKALGGVLLRGVCINLPFVVPFFVAVSSKRKNV